MNHHHCRQFISSNLHWAHNTLTHTRTRTHILCSLGPVCRFDFVASPGAKIISRFCVSYKKSSKVIWTIFSFPQYAVFPFLCVFWSRLLRRAALWWGAGWSGAAVLFLAAAAVGGSRDGVERSGSKPRLFKGILICNDQRHYGLTLTAGRAAR